MPNIRMTVKYINDPKPGKVRGSIKGTDDSFLGVHQDKLSQFEVGKTYDIEYTENGEWKTVTSAREIPIEKPHLVTNEAKPASSSGTYRETCAKDAERMFVCATLGALIKAGEVKNDKRQLWEATNMLRGLWGATFGDGNTFYATDAGPRAVRG